MGTVNEKFRYARRVAEVARRQPSEFLDRLQGQIEIRRERSLPRPALTSTGLWMEELHRLMGWPAQCTECSGFESVWAGTEATMAGTGHVTGKGYDAGISLARAAYAATRHMRPAVVIETGVARGVTSRVVLEGMRENDGGHLYSVDLPPLADGWHDQSAVAVTDDVKDRWTYVRGASRRVLPGLLDRHAPLPVFIHDSLHTYRNMRREMTAAWAALAPGGLLLCDDVEDNHSFIDFAHESGADWIVAQEDHRSGFIGAIRRPAED